MRTQIALFFFVQEFNVEKRGGKNQIESLLKGGSKLIANYGEDIQSIHESLGKNFLGGKKGQKSFVSKTTKRNVKKKLEIKRNKSRGYKGIVG